MEYDRADKEVAEMSKIKVNEQRAVDEFQELTAIDAPSFGERQMADRLIVKLKELGFEVEEDNAGKHFGGNAGNLYAYLPGDLPGDPVLLSGHMDTVEPSKGKKGIIGEDGVISDCKNTGTVTADVANVGGIAGEAYLGDPRYQATIEHCQNEGIVFAANHYYAGIVADVGIKADNTYAITD